MGHLDEAAFARTLAACPHCHGTAFEVAAYLDRAQSLMLADPNGDGRWAYDGEKFIDGVYRVRCLTCRTDVFASDACPRCHADGALPAALTATSRLAAPKRCPKCQETEVSIVGFAPAIARVDAGKPGKPVASALYGDAGFHVIAMACDSCDWAQVAEGCPICGNANTLRHRP